MAGYAADGWVLDINGFSLQMLNSHISDTAHLAKVASKEYTEQVCLSSRKNYPLDNERDVAHTIADDDLLALPVVNDAGALLGIVTVDDAIDVILPTAWKKRIPRLFH